MIQKELDLLEQQVLTDLFGGYTADKFVMRFGIFKYDLAPKIQKIITDFEKVVKPFMNNDGYVDGIKIKQHISVPYLQIPDRLFRPIEIYRDIQPLLLNLKGYLLP